MEPIMDTSDTRTKSKIWDMENTQSAESSGNQNQEKLCKMAKKELATSVNVETFRTKHTCWNARWWRLDANGWTFFPTQMMRSQKWSIAGQQEEFNKLTD